MFPGLPVPSLQALPLTFPRDSTVHSCFLFRAPKGKKEREKVVRPGRGRSSPHYTIHAVLRRV